MHLWPPKSGFWSYKTWWSLKFDDYNYWYIQIVVLHERWSLNSGVADDRLYCTEKLAPIWMKVGTYILGHIGWKSIEIMPGLIGWIGWKSIEIMPGRIGQIWWLNWSNWVEIHWDYAWSNWASSASYAWPIQWISTQFDQFDQAGIQCNLNGFPPNLTTQFIEMMPGQIGWKSIEMMPAQIGQIG